MTKLLKKNNVSRIVLTLQLGNIGNSYNVDLNKLSQYTVQFNRPFKQENRYEVI